MTPFAAFRYLLRHVSLRLRQLASARRHARKGSLCAVVLAGLALGFGPVNAMPIFFTHTPVANPSNSIDSTTTPLTVHHGQPGQLSLIIDTNSLGDFYGTNPIQDLARDTDENDRTPQESIVPTISGGGVDEPTSIILLVIGVGLVCASFTGRWKFSLSLSR